MNRQARASGVNSKIIKLDKKAIKIPKTILNWNKPVSLPLSDAGDISAMNRGAAMVEIPMPIPPINLKIKVTIQNPTVQR